MSIYEASNFWDEHEFTEFDDVHEAKGMTFCFKKKKYVGLEMDIYEKIRKSRTWAIWREKVFKRDRYTCQKCFQIGQELHPHHIQNSSEHEGLRFKVSNGITFCKRCHHNFHNKYGRRSNTKGQVKEYLVLQMGAVFGGVRRYRRECLGNA